MSVTFDCDRNTALINLWKGVKTMGMGFCHSHTEPTLEDAELYFKDLEYVDYFFGRAIKTDFTKFPILSSYGYDRDAGIGTMLNVANNCAKNYSPTQKLSDKDMIELAKKCPIDIKLP